VLQDVSDLAVFALTQCHLNPGILRRATTLTAVTGGSPILTQKLGRNGAIFHAFDRYSLGQIPKKRPVLQLSERGLREKCQPSSEIDALRVMLKCTDMSINPDFVDPVQE